MNLPHPIALRTVQYDERRAAEWKELLSPDEQSRLESFGSEKRRSEFIAGRVALRTLLAGIGRYSPQTVPIRVSEEGAVVLPEDSVYLSLAHSHRRAVAAVAQRRIGVDVEFIRDRNPDVHHYFLHESEYDWFHDLSLPHNEAQLVCWVAKEAVLKGIKTGLRCSPKRVRLSGDPIDGVLTARLEGKINGEEEIWHVRVTARNGFLLGVGQPVQTADTDGKLVHWKDIQYDQ